MSLVKKCFRIFRLICSKKEAGTKCSLVKSPDDESRFLMENLTRSGFFIGRMNVAFMYVVASSG